MEVFVVYSEFGVIGVYEDKESADMMAISSGKNDKDFEEIKTEVHELKTFFRK